MGLRDFPNQVVSAQHADLSGRSRSLTFQFGAGNFGSSEQQGTQVAVAEAVDGKFAAIDRRQEAAIVRTERFQGTDAAALQFGGLTKIADQFAQRLVMIYCRQRASR